MSKIVLLAIMSQCIFFGEYALLLTEVNKAERKQFSPIFKQKSIRVAYKETNAYHTNKCCTLNASFT